MDVAQQWHLNYEVKRKGLIRTLRPLTNLASWLFRFSNFVFVLISQLSDVSCFYIKVFGSHFIQNDLMFNF